MLQQIFSQSVWVYLLGVSVFVGVLSKILSIIHYKQAHTGNRTNEPITYKVGKSIKKTI